MINTNYEKLHGLLKTNFCYSTQTLRMWNIKKNTKKQSYYMEFLQYEKVYSLEAKNM